MCRYDNVTKTAELKQLIKKACPELKTQGKYIDWNDHVTVFFMMLHVARLWEVIIRITSPLAKQNLNQSGKLP